MITHASERSAIQIVVSRLGSLQVALFPRVARIVRSWLEGRQSRQPTRAAALQAVCGWPKQISTAFFDMAHPNTVKILAVISCIVFINFLFLTRSNVDLSESRTTLEAEVASLERKRDSLLLRNADMDRQIHRMELKLEHLEVEARDITDAKRNRKHLPTIFFVTPTKYRPEQKADLTRLAQTLAHVPNLFWIIVEDAEERSSMVQGLLSRLKFTSSFHLAIRTPVEQRMNASDPNWKLPRGVLQRNAALAYLRTNHRAFHKAVVYFGDDDNTYDWRLFEEMRNIRRIGVWPVGIVGGQLVESPLVSGNRVSGFNSLWKPERPFPIDMAAFAVNLSLIVEHPDAAFSFDVPRGYQESQFLTSLGLARADLEPLAHSCSEVFVWHTRTEASKLSVLERRRFESKNLSALEMKVVA